MPPTPASDGRAVAPASAPRCARRADARARRHLRGDGALPDELVDAELRRASSSRAMLRASGRLAGGADRLVRLLRVLDFVVYWRGRVGQVLGAVELAHLGAGGVSASSTGRRVGAHVGDVAVLVEPLRDAHRALRLKRSLRPASCCNVEVMNGAAGTLRERAFDDLDHLGGRAGERFGGTFCRRTIE